MGNRTASKVQEDPLEIRLRELGPQFNFLTDDSDKALSQLLFWSLAEVRLLYEKYRRSSFAPILGRSNFAKLLPFTKSNSFFIYNTLLKGAHDPNAGVCIYEFISLLTITSYTNSLNKMCFLYSVFDLDNSKSLEANKFTALFASLTMGMAKLTNSKPASRDAIEGIAKLIFMKADVAPYDNQLSIEELRDWVDTNELASKLFHKYEPPIKIKEKESMFAPYKPYIEADLQSIIAIILGHIDSHNNNGNKNEVGEVPEIEHIPSTTKYETHGSKKGNFFRSENTSPNRTTQNQSLPFLLLTKHNKPDITKERFAELASRTPIDDDSLRESKPISELVKIRHQMLKDSRTKSKSIIISNGKSISKTDVGSLKNYFYKLSDNNDTVNFKNFSKTFSRTVNTQKISASIFNYLEGHHYANKKATPKSPPKKPQNEHNGEISFPQLVNRMYPDLTEEQMSSVLNWGITDKTNSKNTIKLDPIKASSTKKMKGTLKKEVPKEAIVRMKSIFDLYDDKRKGYVTLEDLKPQFQGVLRERDLIRVFENCDKDNDGKLNLYEFIHLVLPPDYELNEMIVKNISEYIDNREGR